MPSAVLAHLARTPWEPLRLGADATPVWRSLDAIAAHLVVATPPTVSLSTGSAGIGVFLSAYARATGDAAASTAADSLSAELASAIGEQRLSVGLYGGFTGIAWSLNQMGYGDDDTFSEVDNALTTLIGEHGQRLHYDLIAGLAGVGVYALRPSQTTPALLDAIVTALATSAESQGQGIAWREPAEWILDLETRARHPTGRLNLGMAHGVPGVIAVLAASYRRTPTDRIAKLLDGSVSWLVDQIELVDGHPVLGYSPGDDRLSRTAWCYGAPGAAVALLQAAGVRNPAWETAGHGLALTAADKRGTDSGVVDFGLCHGAAGLAHLFNVLYQRYGHAAYKHAATHWLDNLLMRLDAAGVAADHHNHPLALSQPTPLGFLEGLAGAGLALLSSVEATPPTWDTALGVCV